MKTDFFSIYIDQLKDGRTEEFSEKCNSDFLGVQEEDLHFGETVAIEGEAYIAGEMLVMHLNLKAQAIIPCLICNQPVVTDVEIKGLYHSENLETFKSGIFDFRDVVREAILLETPAFAECSEGNCPIRKEVEKYIRPPSLGDEEVRYHPFADL